MWDDIVIGKGEHYCSAIHVFKLGESNEHSVSENRISYWIRHNFAGLQVGMRIFKDTTQGKEITQIIESGGGLKKLNKYLDKLILSKIKPSVMKELIENQRNNDYELGRKAKAEEIRDVLGVG